MKYLFKGEPNLVVIDKQYNKIMFRFDEKGEFVTDNLHIIGKAYGHFDCKELKDEEIVNSIEEFKCEKCGKVCKNKQGLNTHLRTCKGE